MTNAISITTCYLNSLEAPHGNKAAYLNAVEKTKKCVRGYSTRRGFCGKIAGLIYRIWNGIKALIGQSDWQRAKRAINNKNFNLLEDNDNNLNQLNIYLNSEYPKELTRIEDADSFLNALIKLNESPTMRDLMKLNDPKLKDEAKNKIAERLKGNPKADLAQTFNRNYMLV